MTKPKKETGNTFQFLGKHFRVILKNHWPSWSDGTEKQHYEQLLVHIILLQQHKKNEREKKKSHGLAVCCVPFCAIDVWATEFCLRVRLVPAVITNANDVNNLILKSKYTKQKSIFAIS